MCRSARIRRSDGDVCSADESRCAWADAQSRRRIAPRARIAANSAGTISPDAQSTRSSAASRSGDSVSDAARNHAAQADCLVKWPDPFSASWSGSAVFGVPVYVPRRQRATTTNSCSGAEASSRTARSASPSFMNAKVARNASAGRSRITPDSEREATIRRTFGAIAAERADPMRRGGSQPMAVEGPGSEENASAACTSAPSGSP